MEQTIKRKVTKVIYYDVQPTTKMQKLDNEKSTENNIYTRTTTDENLIIEKMQKLRISYKYEYYYDDAKRPRKESSDGDIIIKKNESYSAAPECAQGNYIRFEQPSCRSESDCDNDTDNDTLDNDSTLSATEGDDSEQSFNEDNYSDASTNGDHSTDNSWLLSDFSTDSDDLLSDFLSDSSNSDL